MSKEEQFEHIENKIKQAIQNNQPAFDEKAWVKMEALLDKDKKKPRPFYWLWFLLPLLLAGAGSVYLFSSYKNTHGNSVENIAQTSNGKNTVPPSGNSGEVKERKNSGDIPYLPAQKDNVQPSINPDLIKQEQIVEYITEPQKKNELLKEATPAKQIKVVKSKIKTTVARANITINDGEITDDKAPYNDHRKTNITDKVKATIKASENKPGDDVEAAEKKATDKNTLADVKSNAGDTVTVSAIAKNEKKPDVDIIKQDKSKQPVQAKKRLSPFYLLGSLGADIGSVKLFSFGNSSLAAKYGVGLGYQLNKKWSLQTGFYAGKKKYVAGTKDYHVKEHSYWSYYPITKVDAECTVYEIPVILRYNFLQKASVSYYTTVGLSSYLMKKEDYNYYYLRNNMPAEKYYSYTGNKHLFSTLVLSAGVEKKISGAFSLQLEPSVSLPLSGVGDGKVKLFSSAIMLGVKYQPFKK